MKENVIKKFSPLIKKVWLSSPTMHGEELKYMQEAYETNWMSTVGENINAVEQLLCEKIGCKYAVALASGTAALHMAVKLINESYGCILGGALWKNGTGRSSKHCMNKKI